MVTRETSIKNMVMIETRPWSHWAYFDFLTFLMKLSNNTWVYFPSIFEYILQKYVNFTIYSRAKSKFVTKHTTKIDNSLDYSQLITDAMKKIDEEKPRILN